MGAIVGGPIGGWMADRWGRKCSLMFCGVPYLLISYAHYTASATVFKTLLLAGRLLTGVGMGWTSATVAVSQNKQNTPWSCVCVSYTLNLWLGY